MRQLLFAVLAVFLFPGWASAQTALDNPKLVGRGIVDDVRADCIGPLSNDSITDTESGEKVEMYICGRIAVMLLGDNSGASIYSASGLAASGYHGFINEDGGIGVYLEYDESQEALVELNEQNESLMTQSGELWTLLEETLQSNKDLLELTERLIDGGRSGPQEQSALQRFLSDFTARLGRSFAASSQYPGERGTAAGIGAALGAQSPGTPTPSGTQSDTSWGQRPRIRMAPDGTYVFCRPGGIRIAPDGSYVCGAPRIAPDGTFVGTGR